MKNRFLPSLLLLSALLVACETPVHQTEAQTGESAAVSGLRIRAETPAAQQLAAFVDAVRTGEREAVQTLIRDRMAGFLQEIPMEEHVDELMGFHEGFSHITFHDLLLNEPHAAEGLFHNSRTDSYVKIGVEVEKSAPHRIVMISIEPAAAPAP